MKKKGIIVLLIGLVVAPLMLTGVAEARQAMYNELMRSGMYPALYGTKFEEQRCLWCHVEDRAGDRNAYGLDIEAYFIANNTWDEIGAASSIESIDSDGDGYTNIEELNAATWPGFAEDNPGSTVCSDNDGDGYNPEGGICSLYVDCNDNDPMINPLASEVCNDSIDNDCDGKVDCIDNECATDAACIVCTDNDTDGYSVEGYSCGAVDCNDNDLAVSPGAVEHCSDVIDNDCDGLVDCADADCNGDIACAPVCIPEASSEKGKKCRDGIDNDCDDVIDADDPDCGGDTGDTGETEGKGGTCSDAIDNDGDGQTDCADSDCSKNKACR
jgi:hypothetical protein